MNTREKLIQYTAQAIRKRGFYGTGIREILQETQIPKGSLYHHFPTGKEGLVYEAIAYSGSRMITGLKIAIKKKNVVKGLSGVVNLFREELVLSEFTLADPIALVSLEVAEEFPELRRHCSIQYESWLRLLTKFLEKRKVDNPSLKAKVFLAQIEGSYLLAKVHQDESYFDDMIWQIKYHLNY